MKPSTLASYLESLAGLIRATKATDTLPVVNLTEGGRPTIRLTGIKEVGPLPIPSHADAVGFLAAVFPALTEQGAPIPRTYPQTNAEAEVARMRTQLQVANAMIEARTGERDEARRELEALRRTVDRMRVAPSVTVAPAVKPAPAPTQSTAELLSQIVEDSRRNGDSDPTFRPRPHFTVHPVVLAFPMNAQGKTLAASAVTLEEVKALFAWKFLDNRDATKGGYWLAKDPTSPAVHALVATLTKHGAFTRDTIPA